jgi:hypothetical protein
MTKKIQSTYDKLIASMNPKERKSFEENYRDLLLSEMLIAAMQEDNISVRKLAEAAGVSPTIIQGIRSGTRSNVSAQSLFKIFNGLGYNLFAERDGTRIPLDILSSNKNR